MIHLDTSLIYKKYIHNFAFDINLFFKHTYFAWLALLKHCSTRSNPPVPQPKNILNSACRERKSKVAVSQRTYAEIIKEKEKSTKTGRILTLDFSERGGFTLEEEFHCSRGNKSKFGKEIIIYKNFLLSRQVSIFYSYTTIYYPPFLEKLKISRRVDIYVNT